MTEIKRGVLNAAIAFNQAHEMLAGLTAADIDSGAVWDRWGPKVTHDTRVDWRLLKQLESLSIALRQPGGTDCLPKSACHALIGKYVYLRYLRERNILSDERLAEWEIHPDDVFKRDATLTAFRDVCRRLEDWLNGAVFPLSTTDIRASHVRQVASALCGDAPNGQMHLDFSAYDFSYIPGHSGIVMGDFQRIKYP